MKFIKMIRDCSLGRLLPILIGQRRINSRLNYLGLIRTRNACQPLQEVWNQRRFHLSVWPDRDSCQDDENKLTLLKGQSPLVKTS